MISQTVAVFLIFLVKFGISDNPCPLNATLFHDNSCVKLFESPLRYQNASDVCKSLNGSLVSIHDDINNKALLLLAQSRYVVSPIWIGLKCTDNQKYDCNWDDETGSTGEREEYQHFASGNPSLQAGNNVYMLTSSYRAGQWVSVDGRLASFGYFCQFPPIAPIKFCPNLFNGYCYTLHTDQLNEADARKVCQSDCGELASIHSSDENDHINSLSPYGAPSTTTARLGGRADLKVKSWFDGTPFDYTYFVHLESSGTCFAMNMVSNVNLYASQWTSIDCDAKVPFVCKRAMSSTQC